MPEDDTREAAERYVKEYNKSVGRDTRPRPVDQTHLMWAVVAFALRRDREEREKEKTWPIYAKCVFCDGVATICNNCYGVKPDPLSALLERLAEEGHEPGIYRRGSKWRVHLDVATNRREDLEDLREAIKYLEAARAAEEEAK